MYDIIANHGSSSGPSAVPFHLTTTVNSPLVRPHPMSAISVFPICLRFISTMADLAFQANARTLCSHIYDASNPTVERTTLSAATSLNHTCRAGWIGRYTTALLMTHLRCPATRPFLNPYSSISKQPREERIFVSPTCQSDMDQVFGILGVEVRERCCVSHSSGLVKI